MASSSGPNLIGRITTLVSEGYQANLAVAILIEVSIIETYHA